MNLFLIYILSAVFLQGNLHETVLTPDETKDHRWEEYRMENGTVFPNNIVDFYKEFYPDYYSGNPELMSILSAQYKNKVAQLQNNEQVIFYDFSFKEPSSVINAKVTESVAQEYGSATFTINGCRMIDRTDKYLFNRIYKWYNFGYGDGFCLNIWSDEDLFRKVDVSAEQVQLAAILVECQIETGEDSGEMVLFYFDDKDNCLFRIVCCGY